jgi:hypothetical protein
MGATSEARFEKALSNLLTEEEAIKRMDLIEEEVRKKNGTDGDSVLMYQFKRYRDMMESIAAYQEKASQSELMKRLWRLALAIDTDNLRYPITKKFRNPVVNEIAYEKEVDELFYVNILLDTITNMTDSDIHMRILEFTRYEIIKHDSNSRIKLKIVFNRSLEHNDMHLTIEKGTVKLSDGTERLDVLTGVSCRLLDETAVNRYPISVDTTGLTDFEFDRFLDINYDRDEKYLDYEVEKFFKVGKIIMSQHQFELTIKKLDDRFNRYLMRAYDKMIKLSTPKRIEDVVQSIPDDLMDDIQECINTQSMISVVCDNFKDKQFDTDKVHMIEVALHSIADDLHSDDLDQPFEVCMHSHPLWTTLLNYAENHELLNEIITKQK